MMWQYRTIVFEFAKDGLLGEKYIDDESMENTLNEQGIMGWELVSVVMVQEGVLAVLKRKGSSGPASERISKPDHFSEQEKVSKVEEEAVGAKDSGESTRVTANEIQQQEKEHIQQLERQRQQTMKNHERDRVGDIKIS